MARTLVLRSVLLTSGALLIAACASQPAGTTASLDQKYFEREAKNYLKFQHEGQTLYCQNERHAASLVSYKQCITEAGLHLLVENSRRGRNPVTALYQAH